MELIERRERSRVAKVFRALAEAFSKPEPEGIPIPVPEGIPINYEPKVVVAVDGSAQFREHCGVVVAVSGICPICSTRLSPRDDP